MARTHNKDEDKGMHRKAYLGDHIHNALSFIGITPERVSRWIGKPCPCPERIAKLNALDQWVRRVLTGKYDTASPEEKDKAKIHLQSMLQDEEKDSKE